MSAWYSGRGGTTYAAGEFMMNDADFEGTEVLEQIAAAGLLDEFAGAVDADDFERAADVMERAGINEDLAAIVLRKMRGGAPP